MDTKWKSYKKFDIKGIVVILMFIFLSISGAFTRELIHDRYLFDIDFYESSYFTMNLQNIVKDIFEKVENKVGEETNKGVYKIESYKDIKYLAIDGENNIYTNTSMKTERDFEIQYTGSRPYYLYVNDSLNEGYRVEYNGKEINPNSREYAGLTYIIEEIKKENGEYTKIQMHLVIPEVGMMSSSNEKSLIGYDSYKHTVLVPVKVNLSIACICILIFFMLLDIYRRLKNNKSKILNKYFETYSKLFLEFKILIILITPIVAKYTFQEIGFNNRLEVNFVFTGFIFVFLTMLASYTYYIKSVKFKKSLEVSIISMISKTLLKKSVNDNLLIQYQRNLLICMIISIVLCILVGLYFNTLLIPFPFIVILTVGYSYINYYISNKFEYIDYVIKGTENIKNGQVDYKINLSDDENLNILSENINNIGIGLESAIEDRLKSERMKTELITNVSHDLKTPLTAMINYISLMKKEDVKPDHINEYIDVLDKRSQRLKILIEDLFETAKVSSGDLEFNLETTDINQLLTQSIVEMDDFIEESQLDFIMNLPEEEVYIKADGRRMYRVFENLIINITKYSLKGTRVYIDLYEKNKKVYIEMKNISSQPLNFNPEEITERFTRGDLARNTEGSGLGLAIAKGFVEGQGGKLKIDIIGDLFNVRLEFDKIELL